MFISAALSVAAGTAGRQTGSADRETGTGAPFAPGRCLWDGMIQVEHVLACAGERRASLADDKAALRPSCSGSVPVGQLQRTVVWQWRRLVVRLPAGTARCRPGQVGGPVR